MPQSGDPVLLLAVQIVIAHIGHNDTPASALPTLIRDVHRALVSVGGTRGEAARETVFDDHLVCLECGLHIKVLRRHLQTVHNTTSEQYRAKWHLPGDYPMVAREYAALRSSLARRSGLGKRPVSRGRS